MAAILARWGALSPRRRALAGTFAAAAFVAIAIALLLQRDSRVPLFAAPLRPEQVAEVAERLASSGDAFVPTADNVRVDAKRRSELLLRLSLAGIPHAHLASSAEVLEKAGPLTPQTVLEAQQRDGLAGDLASALRGIAGIEDARVIIAPARDGTFADDAVRDATASVKLTLRPGAVLSRATLDGVRTFVAAGVAGLEPKRVAVLDDSGVALGNGPAPPDEAAALQASLQSALDQTVGAGATVVRLRISYDARDRERREITRAPYGVREIASQSADENYKSASKTYAKRSNASDRGSIVEDERIATPAGRIERISVAVAVDAARGLDLEKIRSLAKGALGLVPSRGDTLSVEAVAFVHPGPSGAFFPAAALGIAATLVPPLIVACSLLGCARGAGPLAGTVARLVERSALARTANAVAAFAPAHVRGALQNEPPHTAAAIISALPAATATAVLELYPPEERAAIVRRMARATAPVVPDYQTILRRG